MEEMTCNTVARVVRLTMVRGKYKAKKLPREAAVRLLRGRLDPRDPNSVIDDSNLLDLPPQEVADIINGWRS